MTNGNGNGHGNGKEEQYTDPLAQRLQAVSRVGAVALVAGLAAFLIQVFKESLITGDSTLRDHLAGQNAIIMECVKNGREERE